MSNAKTYKRYEPLIVIFAIIIVFTGFRMFARASLNPTQAMLDFMAAFFFIVGSVKLSRIHAFTKTFQLYDEIAKHSKLYAYLYPFIEIGIGVALLFRYEVLIVVWVTLCLMLIDSLGSYQGIRNPSVRASATLGTVFRLPMTWVTLGEDVLMALMAAATLILYYH